MQIQKTIRAKVIGLTNIKREKLSNEYRNFNEYLKGKKEVDLYSATKQQADRLLWKLRKAKNFKKQPLIIRNDLIRIEKQDTKLSKYWCKMPVYKKSIWVAIQFPNNQEELLKCSVRETKFISKNSNWFLLITVQKDVRVKKRYDGILAVDLGEKHIATSVEFANGSMNIKFYGREVRGIRRHYGWLRKRLGEKKLIKEIKRIGQTETRKINDILHKISREIVNEAIKSNSAIVLGELKGIRKSAKGKRMNRIVSNMPYYKLTKYIEYKAGWQGIQVFEINERETSHICSRCGSVGKRPYQGLFVCPKCGEYNADLNGCINIAKRSLEYILRDGVQLAEPITLIAELR
jgi:putative transposase